MKRLALCSVLMLSVAAPALASPPPKAEPQPASVSNLPADAPLDLVIEEGVEDRTRMLLRCVGPPPPKFPNEVAAAKTPPMSEPAVKVNAPQG
jgi:hypothetical protein